jgi:hypothetical protein
MLSDSQQLTKRRGFYWVLPKAKETHVIPWTTRKQGLVFIAGPGAGKSRIVAREVLHQDFWNGVPSVVIDPIGTITDEFLDKLSRTMTQLLRQGILTPEEADLEWRRVRYVDMSAKSGYVTKWPVYHKLPDQSYSDASVRFLDILEILDPQLREAPRSGMNAIIELGKEVGIIVIALGLGVTEARQMLLLPKNEFKRQWKERLQRLQAETSAREVRDAADYMLNKYANLDDYNRERVTSAYLTKLSLFDDDTMVAMHSATEPSIDWEEVAYYRQVVLLDFRDVRNKFKRRYKLLDVFTSIRDYVMRRDLRQEPPCSVIIDEVSELYGLDVQADNMAFGAEIVRFVDHFRNLNCWPSLLFQHPDQVDERSLPSLLNCGTVAIGRIGFHPHAELLAKTFYDINPHLIKRFNATWLQVGERVHRRVSQYLSYTSAPRYQLVPTNPVEYSPSEQIALAARAIKKTGVFQFLVKISKGEGDIGEMRFADFTNWGRGQWVDRPAVANLRQRLREREGVPIMEMLAEIDARGRSPRKPTITHDLDMTQEVEEKEAAVTETTPVSAGQSDREVPKVFDTVFAQVKELPPETWQLP